MSLRYGLLGLLAEGSASGYDLAKRFEDTIGIVWPASHPQIYSELIRLADEGMVTVGHKGSRGRKAYTITPEGRAAVVAWLGSADIDRTLRSESLFRSFFFWLMEPKELKRHLAAEEAFFAGRAEAYGRIAKAKADGTMGDAPHVKSARLTVEAGARLYTALAEWARWASGEAESLHK